MRIEDCHKGMAVRSVDEVEPGLVEVVDQEDGMVWVRFPVPGASGRTDLVDVDPGDLEPA